MLDVADVADAAAAMVEAESGGAAGMVQRVRSHLEPVGKAERLAGLEPDMLEAARQLLEADREQGRRVEAVQHLAGALAAEVAAIGAHEPVAAQDRLEERQAVDVVEMQMAEEDIDLVRGLVSHLVAESRQARAGIDDDDTRAAANLDAGRAPSELGKGWPRHGYRASHPPEMNLEGVLPGRCFP
jgi:hypothetical protein